MRVGLRGSTLGVRYLCGDKTSADLGRTLGDIELSLPQVPSNKESPLGVREIELLMSTRYRYINCYEKLERANNWKLQIKTKGQNKTGNLDEIQDHGLTSLVARPRGSRQPIAMRLIQFVAWIALD